MKIYIASSWKNQHAVELLTDELRRREHEVVSFVEKAVHDEGRSNLRLLDYEAWIATPSGEEKFVYDLKGATKSDLVIYIGPSGTDAWAEVGAAWAAKVHVIGLWAKGEQVGLMRRMVEWYSNVHDLLMAVATFGPQPPRRG
jgi:hypothetical protein